MTIKLIQIGNSQGLRLPKSLIKQFRLDVGEIEITVEADGIKLRPLNLIPPLETWEGIFKQSANHILPEGDVFDGVENNADNSDWQWK